MTQIIKDSTRVTYTTKSIIDLIMVSDVGTISQQGVLTSGLSDHFIIYCTRKTVKSLLNKHHTTIIRSMKHYSKEMLTELLKTVDLSPVINCLDVNEAWTHFTDLCMPIVDKLAPLKKVRLKQCSEPWFSSEILELIKERDEINKLCSKSSTPDLENKRRELGNKVPTEIKAAKREYFQNVIEENMGDGRNMWKCLKDMGVSSSTRSEQANIGLDLGNGETCFDKKAVANEFCDFFCNVPDDLVKKLKFPSGLFNKIQVKSFYSKKGVLENYFGFSTVAESKVYKLLSTVNTNKATCLDGISAKFIRDGCSVIASPITRILNLSLSQSTVPKAFKEARVVPLYKKGGRGEVGNYRPISILPVVSKIFERIVYDQLSKHLDKHNILYEYQSGFRRSYSIETALIDLSDRIKFSMDKGLYTGMVMIDLQKAFDTVNHAIMSDKLGAIGCDDGSVNWFNSYLSNRSQFIDIKGTLSDRGEVTCGVPQGSILGPILFLIYVNDMKSAVGCDLLLYADDSALLIRGKNIIDIEQKLREELAKLNVWLIDNKLSLHLGKSLSYLPQLGS